MVVLYLNGDKIFAIIKVLIYKRAEIYEENLDDISILIICLYLQKVIYVRFIKGISKYRKRQSKGVRSDI
jgi:hypothetical protein